MRRKRAFRFPFRSSSDLDREVRDEIAFHFEMRTAELMRSGMSEEEARRQALEQFGDIEDARRYCHALLLDQERSYRRALTLEAVMQDLAYAWRQMRRSPSFYMTNVGVLAAGIAMTLVAFVFVDAYLLRALPVPQPDRLAWVEPGLGPDSDVPVPNGYFGMDWTDAEPLFDKTVAWDLDGFALTDGESSVAAVGSWVSPGFGDALTTGVTLGRFFNAEDYQSGAQVAVISHGLWQNRFNSDPGVIGRTLTAHSTDRPEAPISATIIGVLPADMWHFNRFAEVLLPLRTARAPTLVVIKPGETMAQSEAKLNTWLRPQFPDADPAWRVRLRSAQDVYVENVRPALRLAFGTCLLLVVVVAVNVGGLQLTRAAGRRQELAVRTALGAGRRRLARQLVTESLLIAFVAAAFGVAFAQMAVVALRDIIATQLDTPIPGGSASAFVDLPTLGLSFALALGAALLFSIGPLAFALRATAGQRPGTARAHTSGRATNALRAVFVSTQLAAALGLVAGSVTLARAALQLDAVDLGMQPDGVLRSLILLPRATYPEAAEQVIVTRGILASLAENPAIGAAALAAPPPFRLTGAIPVVTATDSIDARHHRIAGDYFGLLQIRLLEGRAFDARDAADGQPAVIVSADVAHTLWPDASALGRQIRLGTGEDVSHRTVIGVVAATKNTVLQDDDPPAIYTPLEQNPSAFFGLLVRGRTGGEQLAVEAQQSLWRVDRDLPLGDTAPLTEVVRAETARHRFLGTLTTVIAALGLFLAALGVYASIAYEMAQRTRELAIRSAVGASKSDTYRLVMRQGARIGGVGAAIGLVLAIAVSRFTAAQLPAVSALHWTGYAVLGTLLAVLVTLALVPTARRATRLDPAMLLRE